MSIGMVVLIAVALLILFGVAQRTLDKMALTDRQALFLTALIFIGGWLPDMTFGQVSINIGGALIPLGVCVYLLIHAGTVKERIRCIVSGLLTAASITVISRFFPADPALMPFDPLLLYGACGGVIAWVLGRSRRSAFVSGALGVIVADAVSGIGVLMRGVDQPMTFGGAGAVDAIVISGITAVMLCELAGEITERMSRSNKRPAEGGAQA